MGKIRLEINMGTDASPRWEVARLNKGTKIKMSVVNGIFDREAKGTFSQTFSLNVEMNRHIFGNTDQVHGSRVHGVVYGKKYRLSLEDTPFSWGVVHLSDEVDVDEDVEIELVGNDKEWSDIVGDMNCQDVKPMTEVKLGWGVKYVWASQLQYETTTKSNGDVSYKEVGMNKPYDPNKHMRIEIPPYYMANKEQGSPSSEHVKPGDATTKESYINLSQPYPSKPYCNLRFCYQAYDLNDNDEWVEKRKYGIIDPNGSGTQRVFETENSSNNLFQYAYFKHFSAHLQNAQNFPHPPQFYVRYWLKSLFKQLGLAFDETAWDSIADLNRLYFYNTNFGYDLKNNEYRSVAKFHRSPHNRETLQGFQTSVISNVPSVFNETQWWINRLGYVPFITSVYDGDHEKNKVWLVKQYGDNGYGDTSENKYAIWASGFVNMEGGDMIANGKNFPDKDVTDCITTLENLLGMRMLYDSRRGKVEFIFLKDILSSEEVVELGGMVSDMYPIYMDVRGFELVYSKASDDNRKAQQEEGEKFGDDFSLAYDYFDYENIIDTGYRTIASSVSAFDQRVSYDKVTGDAYRYKINKDEEQKADGNISYYYPSTYEVAQFVHATEGDVTDEDYVDKIEVGVEPLEFCDVNGNSTIEFMGNTYANTRFGEQLFAKFFEGGEVSYASSSDWIKGEGRQQDKFKTDINAYLPMEFNSTTVNNLLQGCNEYNAQYSSMYGKVVGIPIALSMYPYKRWDASSSDLPLIGTDETFAVGFMRGGGSDGKITITEKDYDGEGHDLWVETVGSYASHYDIMDNYGNMFDYNGSNEGLGYATKDGLISLRLRAEKENPQYDPTKPSTDVCANGFPNTRFFPITNEWAKKRGIFDKFYTEYSYFTTHKSVMHFEIQGLTMAEILKIDLKKKYRKNNVLGWIKSYEYEVDDETGLGSVVLEMYFV